MSAPFFGRTFEFTQPDGTRIEVVGWGDQYHATFETDGYSLVRDPVSGLFHYAVLAPRRDHLRPSGVVAGYSPPPPQLRPGLRIARDAARGHAGTNAALRRGATRWEDRIRGRRLALKMQDAGVARAPFPRDTVGDYVGLCLLVDFPDVRATIDRDEVERFCNESGYTGFGNRGSVYDYFYDNSNRKLRYTNLVHGWYTARHPRGYYTDPSHDQPARARELILEALEALDREGHDLSALTADDGGFVYALNVFHAGPTINNWSEGLWPHAHRLLRPHPVAEGKRLFDYQITSMGQAPTLGTFCHENGHMLCNFPDLYDYGHDSRGAGVYCLMAGGGLVDPRNPTRICAYLRYRAGWTDSMTPAAPGTRVSLRADHNDFLIHRRNSHEYFILENRQRTGRDAKLPDAGIAIWHVDELGSNNHEQMTTPQHYECALEQADGREHLECDVNNGDSTDLFHAGSVTRFSDSTDPHSRWWDDTPSGLVIHSIGPAGATMTLSADV